MTARRVSAISVPPFVLMIVVALGFGVAAIVVGLPLTAFAALLLWMVFEQNAVEPRSTARRISLRCLRIICGIVGILMFWMLAILLISFGSMLHVISMSVREWFLGPGPFLPLLFNAGLRAICGCLAFLFLRFAFTGRLRRRQAGEARA